MSRNPAGVRFKTKGSLRASHSGAPCSGAADAGHMGLGGGGWASSQSKNLFVFPKSASTPAQEVSGAESPQQLGTFRGVASVFSSTCSMELWCGARWAPGSRCCSAWQIDVLLPACLHLEQDCTPWHMAGDRNVSEFWSVGRVSSCGYIRVCVGSCPGATVVSWSEWMAGRPQGFLYGLSSNCQGESNMKWRYVTKFS